MENLKKEQEDGEKISNALPFRLPLFLVVSEGSVIVLYSEPLRQGGEVGEVSLLASAVKQSSLGT